MKKIGNIVKAISFLIVCFACLAVVSKVLQYEHEMQPDLSMKELLWSSIFVTLVAKKYRLPVTLPSVPHMAFDNR